MTNNNVPSEVLEVINMGYLGVGDNMRVKHALRKDGTPCSADKDTCMVVARSDVGYKYYCHRCQLGGVVFNDNLSPSQTQQRMEERETISKPKLEGKDVISLPNDCIPMWLPSRAKEIPARAHMWLFDYGVNRSLIRRHKIAWSPYYKRVIIPIYTTGLWGDTVAKKLIGWIGRDVDYKKGKSRLPKYLTKRMHDYKDRLYYECTTANSNTMVIVEDAISAIRVHAATGYNTLALLTSTLPHSLMRRLYNYRIILWLDGDMMKKSINFTTKFQQLGYKIKSLCTTVDPKAYENRRIEQLLFNLTKGWDDAEESKRTEGMDAVHNDGDITDEEGRGFGCFIKSFA